MRTGFCGSLTTFSSWMLQAVVMIVGGKPLPRSEWVQGLAALVLNVWVCMAALVTGQHMCLLTYHWCVGPAVVGVRCWRLVGAVG
jgi:CrcB protein